MYSWPPKNSATPQYAQLSQPAYPVAGVAPRSVTTPDGSAIEYTREPLWITTRSQPAKIPDPLGTEIAVDSAIAGVVGAPRAIQRIDVPERADGESRLRQAEVILLDVAEHMAATQQTSFDLRQRTGQTRGGILDHVHLEQLQQTRVDLR